MQEMTGYEASGLKTSLHGIVYQLKLLIWVAYQANANSYKFRLATEMGDAGKFDDVVIQILNENNISLMYQAKHFQDNSETINIKDLLSTSNDDPFSLQKYFRSFLNIIGNKEIVTDGALELTICTNIGFKFKNENSYILSLPTGEKIELAKTNDDDIFLKDGLRFNIKNTPENVKFIVNNFEKSTDLKNLAMKIVDCLLVPSVRFVVDSKYERAVMTYIIDGSTGQLREHFLLPNNNLPQNYLSLKDFIYSTIDKRLDRDIKLRESKRTHVDVSTTIDQSLDSDILKLRESKRTRADVLNQKIYLPERLTKLFILDMDPQIEEPDKIAGEIYKAIKSKPKRNKTINLNKLNCIHVLAGHIFVNGDKNTKKFSSNFINKSQQLGGNLNKIRLELDNLMKNEELNLENLIFQIDGKSCDDNEFEQIKETPLFTEKLYESKDVEHFLDKLVFAVNQPDENELGNIISSEIGNEFNLLDASFISNSFLNNILDWFKIKQGNCPYKTSEEVKDFFIEQKNKLNRIALTGPTSVFVDRLKEYNISFNSSIPRYLKDFLCNAKSDKRIVNFVSENDTLLGCLKILNVLDSIKEYKCADSYIFIPWKVLVRIPDKVISAFKKSNVLIVECNTNKKDLNIQYELLKIINSQANKKLIIISRAKCNFVEFFSKHEHFTKIVDEDSTFKDLCDNSQNILKRKEVNFQGIRISLEKIIDKYQENILDLIPMIDFISESTLIVGDKLIIPKYFNKSYYLERHFMLYTVLKNVNLPNKIFYSKNEFLTNVLKRPLDDSSHFIKETSCNKKIKLIWKKSNNNIVDELLQFVDENQSTTFKESDLINNQSFMGIPKLILLSDVPGMGKSTVLTNISLELKTKYPHKWIIKIDLNIYSAELYEIHNKILSKDEYIQFLDEKILKFKTQLEKKLFEESFNIEDKIILMFDGLDEISPNYETPFELLIQALLKTSVCQIWISTRSYIKEELRKKYKQFFFSLKPFTQNEREEFLKMYWQRDDKNDFAKKVLKLLSDSISDKEMRFTGIPLQIKLLGDYFKNKLDLEDALPDKIDLNELYSHFINNKFNISDLKGFTETRDVKKVNYLTQRQRNEKIWNRDHQYYSFKRIFPDLLDHFFPKNLDTDSAIINNLGICWINDGQPQFIHQTFAEYFIADFLTQWFIQDKTIDDKFLEFINKIFEEKYKTICWFLNGNPKMSDGNFNSKLCTINEKDFSKILPVLVSEEYNQILWILLKSQSNPVIENSIITNAVKKKKISSIIAILNWKASISTEVDSLDYLHRILLESFRYSSKSDNKFIKQLLNWGWDRFNISFVLFRGSILISYLKFCHSNQFKKDITKWKNFHQSIEIIFSDDGYPKINLQNTFMCEDKNWLNKQEVIRFLNEWILEKVTDTSLLVKAKDSNNHSVFELALLFKDGNFLKVVKNTFNITLENIIINNMKCFAFKLFNKKYLEIRKLILESTDGY